jgi:hypothetical protein
MARNEKERSLADTVVDYSVTTFDTAHILFHHVLPATFLAAHDGVRHTPVLGEIVQSFDYIQGKAVEGVSYGLYTASRMHHHTGLEEVVADSVRMAAYEQAAHGMVEAFVYGTGAWYAGKGAKHVYDRFTAASDE